MKLPREPRPGENLSAIWGAQLIRYLKAMTLRPSGSARIATLPGGTTIQVSQRPGAAFSDVSHPFQVLDASDDTDPKIRVVFGQVNSVTPVIDGDPLDQDPAPTLVVASGVVFLQVNLDEDGQIVTAVVANEAALPEATETEGYLTLATVTVTDGAITAINQSVSGSLQHMRCGEHHLFGAV